MAQFNAVSSDFIDNNDEAIYKNILYKPKSIIDIETKATLLENLACQNDWKFWVLGYLSRMYNLVIQSQWFHLLFQRVFSI